MKRLEWIPVRNKAKNFPYPCALAESDGQLLIITQGARNLFNVWVNNGTKPVLITAGIRTLIAAKGIAQEWVNELNQN